MVDSGSAASKNKVLLVVTSASPEFWPGHIRTGYFFTEVAHPYLTFKNHGYDVDVASETGEGSVDKSSVPYAYMDGESRRIWTDKDHELNKKLASLKKPDELNPDDYAIVFVAGGHGAAFDMPKATGIQKVASKVYDNGGVISSVCHGPAIFATLRGGDGNLIVKGKKVTAFSSRGENMASATSALKKHGVPTMEEMMKEAGADWQEPHDVVTLPTTPFTVADGRIVTGVNPMSAADVAQKAVEIVKGGKAEDKRPPKSVL